MENVIVGTVNNGFIMRINDGCALMGSIYSSVWQHLNVRGTLIGRIVWQHLLKYPPNL